LRYQISASNEDLKLTFTEFFNLPLGAKELILENQKEIAKNKAASFKNII